MFRFVKRFEKMQKKDTFPTHFQGRVRPDVRTEARLIIFFSAKPSNPEKKTVYNNRDTSAGDTSAEAGIPETEERKGAGR